MNETYRHLVSDTLTFLKEQRKKIPTIQSTAPPVKNSTTTTPIPPPLKEKTTLSSKPMQKPYVPTPTVDKIQQHLPHIAIKKEIPKSPLVAIVLHDKEEIDFLKKLAQAIQNKFYPVTLVEPGKKDLQPFSLILSQKPLPESLNNKTLLLAKADIYQNDLEEKKKLWAELCKRLSQKSF